MTDNKAPEVVVGVDGSPDSLAALRWAQRYAMATGGTIHLVTTWENPLSYGTAHSMQDVNPVGHAHAVAEKAAAELSLPAGQVTVDVLEGPARQVLVDVSKQANMLVVGSRGHSRVAGLLLGSVSSYCTHHASVPVIVVR